VRLSLLIGLALAAISSTSSACSSEPPAERASQPSETVEQPIVREQPTPPGPQPPTPEPIKPEEPPKPVIDLPPLDSTCKADDDCVPAPGCCSVPCTSNVINKTAMPEARRRLEELCPEPLECGNAGGCRNHAYLCVKGTCALVYEGDKHYRKRR
jgi:hypothetical protein